MQMLPNTRGNSKFKDLIVQINGEIKQTKPALPLTFLSSFLCIQFKLSLIYAFFFKSYLKTLTPAQAKRKRK